MSFTTRYILYTDGKSFKGRIVKGSVREGKKVELHFAVTIYICVQEFNKLYIYICNLALLRYRKQSRGLYFYIPMICNFKAGAH